MLRPASALNPRNGEGSALQLDDGSILLVYSEFYASNASDYGPARVVVTRSKDSGRTWSASHVLVENDVLTTFSPSLLQLSSGEILLAYIRKRDQHDCSYWMQSSLDNGKSWGERWPIIPEPGNWVMNNDRLLQLSSGRIIQPLALITNTTETDPFHCLSTTFHSDDDGRSWSASRSRLSLEAVDGLQEPGLVERSDGSLLMFCRTSQGFQFGATSYDSRETWSSPTPIHDLVSPVSPASIKRIPITGHLLAVYNHTTPTLERKTRYRKRHPLHSAISTDDGQTWQHRRTIETNKNFDYDYTSITFLENNDGGKSQSEVLMTYHAGHSFGENYGQYRRHMKLKIIPLRWFYED